LKRDAITKAQKNAQDLPRSNDRGLIEAR